MRADDPQIDGLIKSEHFHRPPGSKTTLCVLVLHCGHEAVGYWIGRGNSETELKEAQDHARDSARRRVAGLETYRARSNQIKM
jgi:hypothetical protein